MSGPSSFFSHATIMSLNVRFLSSESEALSLPSFPLIFPWTRVEGLNIELSQILSRSSSDFALRNAATISSFLSGCCWSNSRRAAICRATRACKSIFVCFRIQRINVSAPVQPFRYGGSCDRTRREIEGAYLALPLLLIRFTFLIRMKRRVFRIVIVIDLGTRLLGLFARDPRRGGMRTGNRFHCRILGRSRWGRTRLRNKLGAGRRRHGVRQVRWLVRFRTDFSLILFQLYS